MVDARLERSFARILSNRKINVFDGAAGKQAPETTDGCLTGSLLRVACGLIVRHDTCHTIRLMEKDA